MNPVGRTGRVVLSDSRNNSRVDLPFDLGPFVADWQSDLQSKHLQPKNTFSLQFLLDSQRYHQTTETIIHGL